MAGLWLAARTAPTCQSTRARTGSAPGLARAPREARPKCSSLARRRLPAPCRPSAGQARDEAWGQPPGPGAALPSPGSGTARTSWGLGRRRTTAPRRGGSAELQAALPQLTCRGRSRSRSRSEPAPARPRTRRSEPPGGPGRPLPLHLGAISTPARRGVCFPVARHIPDFKRPEKFGESFSLVLRALFQLEI